MGHEIIGKYTPIVIAETEAKFGDTRIVNYSGRSLGEVISFFPKSLKANKIVLMPDLNPGRAPLPSGCSVEINEDIQPDWRRFMLSDIGCGMQVLKSKITWDDFERQLSEWNNLYRKLKANKGGIGDLGSGNHFLDAAVDENEQVYFIIHTGSRNESARAEAYLEKLEKFDVVYDETQAWARENRDTVRYFIENGYGDTELILDKPHNFLDRDLDKVIIYKGAVNLQPKDLTLIPSSMDGDMVIVQGVEEQLPNINYTMAHGTGRLKSRGDSKDDARSYDFAGLRKRIHIPDEISDDSILTENPSCYKSLEACLRQISDLIIIRKRLNPVAYIGQV